MALKPQHMWPAKLRTGKIQAQKGEWSKVARGLIDKGLCEPFPLRRVFQHNGDHLLCGLFAVGKGEYMRDRPEVELQRLIMNLIPFNDLVQPCEGDVSSLPYFAQWGSLEIALDQLLLWSSEDLKAMFYLFRLPPAWRPFTCFNRILDESICPEAGIEPHVLSATVLGMGWVSSVGIAQHLHRRLMLLPSPRGAGLSPHSEIRKDRPMPQRILVEGAEGKISQSRGHHTWQVYLDNFDEAKIVEREHAHEYIGRPSAWQERVREAYSHWSLPRNRDKSTQQEVQALSLGAVIDGDVGRIAMKSEKLATLMGATAHMLSRQSAPLKFWQVAMGFQVYAAQYRRPLMAIFQKAWPFMAGKSLAKKKGVAPWNYGAQKTPREVKEELLLFLCLLPLARIDLTVPYSGEVLASDASEVGAGVCASTSLTRAGQAALLTARGGSSTLFRGENVLAVRLFDGIGAFHRALSVIGCAPLGYISVEWDERARRCVEFHCEGVLAYKDVRDINGDVVKSWALRFPQAKLLILGAGPPCQGVSGLNSQKLGALKDPRSSLCVEVERIRKLLFQCFPWAEVKLLQESVASMSASDRALHSQEVDLYPLEICAGGSMWARRPRLYWINWPVEKQEGVSFSVRDTTTVVELKAQRLPIHAWITPGWSLRDPSITLPTFTRSITRLRPPPDPAGIRTCSPGALARWKDSQYRFPPYTFKTESCLQMGVPLDPSTLRREK